MRPVTISARRRKGVCSAIGCSNRATSTLCSTCRSRKSRLADPVRYSYNTLKSNAKRRGKDFTLTPDEFKRFCIKTNYIAGKGRSADSYTVDRRDEDRGYHADNIGVLTNSQNVRKRFLHYDWRTKTATVLNHEQSSEDDWSEAVPEHRKDTYQRRERQCS
jgi:hypothetical protein